MDISNKKVLKYKKRRNIAHSVKKKIVDKNDATFLKEIRKSHNLVIKKIASPPNLYRLYYSIFKRFSISRLRDFVSSISLVSGNNYVLHGVLY